MRHIDRFQMEHLTSEALSEMREQINRILGLRKSHQSRQKRSSFIASLKPIKSTSEELFISNSSSLLGIPRHWARMHQSNAKLLPALLAQDWSFLYGPDVGDKTHYVYAHVNPTKSVFCAPKEAGGNYGGQPFYIGKGSGLRAYNLKRNQGHGKILKKLIDDGHGPEAIVKIILDKLTEAKAYEIEAKLIYYFGTIYSQSVKKKGLLLNLDVPKVPDFVGVMQLSGDKHQPTGHLKQEAK